MSLLIDAISSGRIVEDHRPWTRSIVDTALWNSLASQLAEGRSALLGLWGDQTRVHMALLDEEAHEIAVATYESPDGTFPSVGRLHPPAIRPERAIRDLFGLEPVGLPDHRPWLDHGRWDLHHPLGDRAETP